LNEHRGFDQIQRKCSESPISQEGTHICHINDLSREKKRREILTKSKGSKPELEPPGTARKPRAYENGIRVRKETLVLLKKKSYMNSIII
jgi:hypothetical protein